MTLQRSAICAVIAAALAVVMVVLTINVGRAAMPKIIGCDQDIDSIVNSDPSGVATRFVLQADCGQAFVASQTLNPKNGDQMVCAEPPTFRVVNLVDGIEGAYEPSVSCGVGALSNVSNVFHPTGTVYLEGFRCEGGNYTGTGTGACLAMGAASSASDVYGVQVADTEALGISNAHGTYRRIELSNNTTNPNALGITGSAIKGVDEFVIQHSYIHDEQGNGIWCDNNCDDQTISTAATGMVTKFQASFNAVAGADKEGIRWENVGTAPSSGEAQIDYNLITGNGIAGNRFGVGVRDAQNATITKNVFGSYLGYPHNKLGAVRASDSDKSSRPNLLNIDITANNFGGERTKGCELPDTVVACSGNN